MGSLLLAAGAKDQRFALPNARIMVHQPSGGFQGQATDIMLHAQEILNLKKRLNEIYVKHTGQSLKKIEDALERDYFLTAEAARDFGLVDKVIDKRPEETTAEARLTVPTAAVPARFSPRTGCPERSRFCSCECSVIVNRILDYHVVSMLRLWWGRVTGLRALPE